MPASARNAFFGQVTHVRRGTLLTEVALRAQGGLSLASVITTESFESLLLSEGAAVTALIKPPEVLVGRENGGLHTSARNNFKGRVLSLRSDGVAVEIMGELDGGTPMCALITAKSLASLDIRKNDEVNFFFKTFNLILSAS